MSNTTARIVMTANALLAPGAGPGLHHAALCPKGKVKTPASRKPARNSLPAADAAE
jgi:hypothetical protein